MDLFEVGQTAFDDLGDFNSHIADPEQCNISGNLHVIAAFSQYEKPDFFDLLSSHGYQRESLGDIDRVSKSYISAEDAGDEETEYTAEFYVHFHTDVVSQGGVVLFYTNQRKTEEIDETVKSLLREQHGLYYLHIGTNLFQSVRDQIKKREDLPEITEFVADRSAKTDRIARIRDEINERTITYFGDDGWETLYEMEENYGVAPRHLVFNIPNKAEFKIARDGIFSLQKGELEVLFQYIEFIIQKSLDRKKAFDSSEFEMVSTTPSLSIPTSEPAVIKLKRDLDYEELPSIKADMERSDYFVVDSFEQEGSVHVSSKIYDEQRENTFRIKASDNTLRVFPEEKDGDLGTFLRFYEFVQNKVDPAAEAMAE